MPNKHRHSKEFSQKWKLITEPTQVQQIVKSVNITDPERFNQLMVAYDPSGSAYYAVYGSGGLKDKSGKAFHDAGTPFDLLYDRGDLPKDW